MGRLAAGYALFFRPPHTGRRRPDNPITLTGFHLADFGLPADPRQNLPLAPKAAA
jgi:hypothetical protein